MDNQCPRHPGLPRGSSLGQLLLLNQNQGSRQEAEPWLDLFSTEEQASSLDHVRNENKMTSVLLC